LVVDLITRPSREDRVGVGLEDGNGGFLIGIERIGIGVGGKEFFFFKNKRTTKKRAKITSKGRL
jgi:hypothetical protein